MHLLAPCQGVIVHASHAQACAGSFAAACSALSVSRIQSEKKQCVLVRLWALAVVGISRLQPVGQRLPLQLFQPLPVAVPQLLDRVAGVHPLKLNHLLEYGMGWGGTGEGRSLTERVMQ